MENKNVPNGNGNLNDNQNDNANILVPKDSPRLGDKRTASQ